MNIFHIIIRFMGIEIPVSLPRRPRVGQIVNLLVNGQRIPMIFDGTGFFHQRKVDGTTTIIPQVKVKTRIQPTVDPRPIPEWAQASTDPRIEYLVEQSEFNSTVFYQMLYASAWKDALLYTGNAAAQEDELAFRWLQLDTREAKRLRRSLSNKTAKEVKRATRQPRIGKPDKAGEWLAALGQDDPIRPEDAVVFATDSAEMEALSNLVTSESERDEGEWGVETPKVEWSMDVISELLAHAGKIRTPRGTQVEDSPMTGVLSIMRTYAVMGVEGAQAAVDAMELISFHDPKAFSLTPLASVLATLEAKRDLLSEKQTALVDSLIAQPEPTYAFRNVMMRLPNGKRERREIMTRINHISSLVRRASALEWDIEHALDEYESKEADWDEIAHPRVSDAPKVAVSVERQATYLDWIAKKAEASDKPWFADPAYIAVLSNAFDTNARTPTEASNRAYAAYRLRKPANVKGYDPDMGFTVTLNGKGQQAVVTRDDARAAMKYLPAGARQHLNALAKKAS